MELYFEVVDGPRKGFAFKIKTGLIIGRIEGDITLNDPKVSSRHAHIDISEKGQLVLKDDGSTNGILINGVRVNEIVLMQGVTVQLGRSFLKVKKSEDIAGIAHDTEPKDWKGILKRNFLVETPTFETHLVNVRPFNPALKLTFTHGIQMEQTWILGYGPRSAGKKSLDLEILEENAPDICFELLPTENGTKIHFPDPSRVFLNKGSENDIVLKNGDTIHIGKTVILVSLIP